MDIPNFYDVTWLIFETLCPGTKTIHINQGIQSFYFQEKGKVKGF